MAYFTAVPDFPNYVVSTDGEVVSLFFGKFKPLRPATVKKGYRSVALRRTEGVQESRNVHEIVLTSFRGPKQTGQQCRHLNGIPSDNRLDNLAWGTALENAQDRQRHGTARGGVNAGEGNVTSKLNNTAVLDIRTSKQTGVFLAKKYGVCPTAIGAVRSGKTWRHLPC